jgi:murein DD-endopeptidase MepM/ murein hydrolase activator NlpD
MTKVLKFGIGMLFGAGLTAYFFVAIQHGPAAASALAVAQPTSLQLASAPESDAMPPANAPQAGSLIIPVDGIRPSQLTDTYNDRRGGARPHEALDIMAPRGTPVLAAADGKIVKLFDSKPGGLTIYEFDPSESVAYYYAHLDRYAPGIAAGLQVKQGEVIGYVGSTGNASPDAPHLHFAIFRLGPEKNWWQGTPINPYPLLAGR